MAAALCPRYPEKSLRHVWLPKLVVGFCFGYSAGAKAAFKNEEAESTSEVKAEDTKHMTITYNFPRVVLQFDEDSLELSNECEKALEQLKDKGSLQASASTSSASSNTNKNENSNSSLNVGLTWEAKGGDMTLC
ncbi:hypothetical protein BDV36DRAFT_296418 [Aspergillus pseudocaelatus]|uniref:Uncharacterized protein n=1 Tax=Aspergillus pseudocaelatus TaxID=1825620 RepID=A0ABQ6WJ08_9EURO|nr:hypothetical protein BDV36DRAFT_296418 [Aspergillus pseudocaelatus]